MISEAEIRECLPLALDAVDLPLLEPVSSGKVREIFQLEGNLILVTTDRLSAFDRILGLVPFKGQVLNQLSAFWFAQTSDIVANHLSEVPDENVSVVRRCEPLPVEVVVRGHITGVTTTALWYRYAAGERNIYGLDFPDGLHKNDPLPEPIITPTTKARDGGHDERLSSVEVVERGLVEPGLWRQTCDAAVALFNRGQEIAAQAGLVLVDTKYEFGVDEAGNLTLIDEVHTPDSSRYWKQDTVEQRTAQGLEPENFDKEFIRLFYAEKGYRGEGEPLPLPEDLAVHAAQRYVAIYEMLTGNQFVPGELPAQPRIRSNVERWLAAQLHEQGPGEEDMA
jgi:phosphoribosylaminoimidazole-succinocarboxamide synthase